MRVPRPQSQADDAGRIQDARSRLEELLRNAGPNIKVTPRAEPPETQVRGTLRPQSSNARTSAPPAARAANQPEASPAAAKPTPARASAPPGETSGRPSPAVTPRPPTRAARIAAPRPAGADPRLASPQAAGEQPPSPPPGARRQRPASSGAAGPGAARPARAAAQAEALPSHQGSAAALATARPGAATAAKAPPSASTAPSAEAASERPRPHGGSELQTALAESRRAFIATGAFSFVINLLMLAGPLFMLQVYDRVMTSGSVPTLLALMALTAGAYAVIGVLELVRSRVVSRIAHDIDGRLAGRVFDAALKQNTTSAGSGGSSVLRELDHLRQFVSSPGPLAFFDAPWTPVYVLVIFMVHWLLGVTAVIGAVLLIAVAWLSEQAARSAVQETGKASARAIELAETGQRNAEAITAMGMAEAYRGRWLTANREALSWQLLTADRLGGLTALSKTLRLLWQSLMLAVGAWLALDNLISAGAIVAATIIFGRAIAPVEQALGHWRPFLKARDSYAKLDALLQAAPPSPQRTALPRPSGVLEVKGLRVASPETRILILNQISFRVSPGQMLAVIGPSASGKSSLVRALVGLWPPLGGTITLDGARLDQWAPDELGQHIGYLPQSVELFAGTVRENIARFSANATDEEVIGAARQAHAHDMILALPHGYDTQLGAFGTYLSGGQRQRIALARALFRNPPLVVLDEPNANLDRIGDVALAGAIDGMRARGQTVVLVSHRVQAIGKSDLLLYIDRGVQRAFGPREEVMSLLRGGDNGGDIT